MTKFRHISEPQAFMERTIGFTVLGYARSVSILRVHREAGGKGLMVNGKSG